MAEPETEQPLPPQTQTKSPTKKPAHASFSIWPPSDRTREAIRNRLIDSLSAPSILSKRYGTVSRDEAEELAKMIEEEAFGCAGKRSDADADDGERNDGIEILQVYSKEISRKMHDTVKAKSSGEAAAADATEQEDLGPRQSEKSESVAADEE